MRPGGANQVFSICEKMTNRVTGKAETRFERVESLLRDGSVWRFGRVFANTNYQQCIGYIHQNGIKRFDETEVFPKEDWKAIYVAVSMRGNRWL